MVGEQCAEGSDQRCALDASLVEPVEARHGVLRLEDLLCCALKGEDRVGGRIDLLDVLPRGDHKVAVLRDVDVEWDARAGLVRRLVSRRQAGRMVRGGG